MGDPTFTVVTKAYNEEALIGDAIRSALAQTRDDFELIVVDDGSTDGTADVVRSFEPNPRVRLISQPNRGVAAAMNTGIAAGSGRYVALLDADDLWMPTYLERMGEALDADPEAGFAYTDAWWLDDASGRFFKGTMSERLGAPSDPPRDPHQLLKLLIPSNWLFGLTTMRRTALEEVGGVNESLRGSEDYELWIRLLAAGYGAARASGRLVVWRDRGTSLSSDERGMVTTMQQVYRMVDSELEVPDDVKALARERLSQLDRELRVLDGRSPGLAAKRALRHRLGRIRKAVLPGLIWYSETPPEVAGAFPHLNRGRDEPAAARRQMAPLRVAVYGEFNYRRDDEGLSTDQSFALFVARLAAHVDRLVVVGRLDPEPGATHHRLPDDFEFVALPDYASLANLPAVLRATFASIPRLWRSLDDVDAVWLLGPNPLGIVFALLAKLRRRRVVLGVRQDIVALTRSRYGRGIHRAAAVMLERIWRLLARRAAVVTVGTDLERQYAGAREVVPISVSLVDEADLVSPEQAEKRDYGGRLTALSVGRLEPQKNPLLLADVLAELRRRDERWHLVVCGSGSMEDELAGRLDQLGVAEHADLRGYVPVEGGLQGLYRDSHAFLHVSWTEGFPQVLVEAFAAGLPTVATAVGGIEDWAADGALLVPPGDASAAADALQRISEDPELRGRLIAGELELARRHTADAECARVVEALREGH